MTEKDDSQDNPVPESFTLPCLQADVVNPDSLADPAPCELIPAPEVSPEVLVMEAPVLLQLVDAPSELPTAESGEIVVMEVATLDRVEETTAEPTPPPVEPGYFTLRALQLVKWGNSPEECDDAWATVPERGMAAVCDGASEAIFARQWARLLVQGFASGAPDLRHPDIADGWVAAAREAWWNEINYPKLRWSQKKRVDEVGAAGTFVGLHMQPEPGTQGYKWWVAAWGDSCLFWLRNGDLMTVFPIGDPVEFSNPPTLLYSRPRAVSEPVLAQEICLPGDVFVLASDAVAKALLQDFLAGGAAEWSRFETISQEAWEEEIFHLRQQTGEARMVNDDCTLLYLRVGPCPVLAPPSDGAPD